MSKSRLIPWLSVLAFAPAVASAQETSPSHKIDTFIEAGYKTHKVAPNAPANDEIFCRRIYLDVIGRIPSKEELTSFLNDADKSKRSKLIDKLLESEGYTSHWFNYWADILRVKTDMQNQAGAAYADWVKKAVRNNMPYDQFVKELVGAKGYVWENGAVGYYMRDAGMPLDNMSNTAQIFLGTRVVCAQCHNHPFDKWTQKDYYEMAAFTYGVDTEMNPNAICEKLPEVLAAEQKKMAKEDARAAKRKNGGRKDAGSRNLDAMIREILEPLSYGVAEQKRDLKLPMDYKYDDAEPGMPIDKAKALFAQDRIDKEASPVKVDGNTRDDLVKWMCDKQNPRFTSVIVNRLWKRAFGVGLIEPVDDFKDDTVASNQPLMRFLVEEMSRQKYDVKKFLRMLYNTRTYQRECTKTVVNSDEPYYFPGPILRRMSSEQIWDSVVTLMIPDPDYRLKTSGYAERLKKMKEAADELKKRYVDSPTGAKDLVAQARAMADAGASYDGKLADARKKLTDARAKKDAPAEKAAQAEVAKLTQERLTAVYKAQALKDDEQTSKKSTMVMFDEKPLPMSEKKDEKMMDKDPLAGRSGTDYSGYSQDYFRASELGSPAPNGHFLHEFGQSEREVIENSWNDASVTQALSLMNGKVFEDLTSDKSQLAKVMQYALSTKEKSLNLWLAVLNRYPTEEEKNMVGEVTEGKGKNSWKDVFWAMLNGREFIFIQ